MQFRRAVLFVGVGGGRRRGIRLDGGYPPAFTTQNHPSDRRGGVPVCVRVRALVYAHGRVSWCGRRPALSAVHFAGGQPGPLRRLESVIRPVNSSQY